MKITHKTKKQKKQLSDGSYVNFLIHSFIDEWRYTRVG